MSLTKVTYSMINGSPFNVLDYGANTVPGTTDMTSVIQAALDACGVAGTPGTWKAMANLA